jgi:hypothetical protein
VLCAASRPPRDPRSRTSAREGNGEIFTKAILSAAGPEIRQRGKQSTSTRSRETRSFGKPSPSHPSLLVNVVDEMLVVQRGKELGYR